MSTSNIKLQHIIEQICASGCDRVYEIIDTLEQHQHIDQTRELNKEETTIVLQELKAIMAVYKEK